MANVSERELFVILQDALLTARDASRGLALHRGDARWLTAAGLFDQLKDNTVHLFTKGRAQGSAPPIIRPPGVKQ